jgi:hypothetical protein
MVFWGDLFATSLLFKRGFKTAWFFGEISLRLLFCLKMNYTVKKLTNRKSTATNQHLIFGQIDFWAGRQGEEPSCTPVQRRR